MNTTDIQKTHVHFVWAILLAFGAVVSAILLDSVESKTTAYAILIALLGFVLIFYFSNQKTLTNLAIFFLVLGIPFNLDLNLFLRTYVGVASVDIGISLLCALALYALFAYDHFSSGSSAPMFRYNRTLFWAPILYILSGILSLYNASSSELVILELVRLGMLFIIFFIVMNLQNRKQIDVFVFALSVGVILQTLIGLYQYKTGLLLGLDAFGERLVGKEATGFLASRAVGTIGHGNMLAYYFEILIPFMFAMFLVEEKGLLKLWYLITTVAGIIGITITQSRGGWVSLPVSLSLVFFLIKRHDMSNRKFLIGLFATGFIIIVLFFPLYPIIEKRWTGPDYGSAATRPVLNKAAMSLVEQYPVLGVGLNNMAKVFRTYDTTGGSSVFRGGIHVVHNLYLGVWAETGTIGLLTFLWMFIGTFFVAVRALPRAHLWQKGILVGATAGLIGHLIHGFADPGFRIIMSISMLVYAMFGIIGAMSLLSRKETGKAIQ